MKRALFSTMILILGTSFSALADTVVIKGSPVILEKRGDVCYVPDTYTTTTDYYYVTVDGTNKVCYATKQEGITLDALLLNISMGGNNVTWNCYDYDAKYFTLEP